MGDLWQFLGFIMVMMISISDVLWNVGKEVNLMNFNQGHKSG